MATFDDFDACIASFKNAVDSYNSILTSTMAQWKALQTCRSHLSMWTKCANQFIALTAGCNQLLTVTCGYTGMMMAPQGELYMKKEDCGCGHTPIIKKLIKEVREADDLSVIPPNPGQFPFGYLKIPWQKALDNAIASKDINTCTLLYNGQLPFIPGKKKGFSPPPPLAIPPVPPLPPGPPTIGTSIDVYILGLHSAYQRITVALSICTPANINAYNNMVTQRDSYDACCSTLEKQIAKAKMNNPNSACAKIKPCIQLLECEVQGP